MSFSTHLERFDFHRNVDYFPSENVGKDSSDLKLREFFRTEQWIALSGVAHVDLPK